MNVSLHGTRPWHQFSFHTVSSAIWHGPAPLDTTRTLGKLDGGAGQVIECRHSR